MNHVSQAAVIFGIVLSAVIPARALPIGAEFPTSPLGLVDRDSVRDPYRGFAGVSDLVVTAVPMARTPAPTLPTLGAFGGGGGFSAGSVFGFSFPALVMPPRTSTLIAPPPSGGVYFSLSNVRVQSNVVIGVVQVPEGGITLLLFLLSLAPLAFFQRARVRRR